MRIGFSVFCAVVVTIAIIPLNSSARVFHNSKGKEIDAEIKSVSGDRVTLIRAVDKKEFTIATSTLSATDRDFLKTWKPPEPKGDSKGDAPMSKAEPGDIEVKAGAKFSLSFPELKEDRKGDPASVGIAIPTGYDPGKPSPLFVWMGGGDGGNGPTTSGVVDGGQFITAGLPFPKGYDNPGYSKMVGDYKNIWRDYHQPMLAKLFDKIPNIDRKLCIIGGFSNGAHCIAGVLREAKDGGYPEFFNCYVLVDGGNGDTRLRGGKGNYLFATWGETSPNAIRCEEAAKKASGMERGMFEMEGVGHAFAEVGKTKVKEWLDTVVIPATLGTE